MSKILPQQSAASTDVQRSSYSKNGDEIKVSVQTSCGRGYVSSTVTNNVNGSSSGVTDQMKYDISTKTPAVYGSNKSLYLQSGRGYPIFMSAGSEFEVTADNVTRVSGSPEEFGNDFNTARYEAMMDYNCTLLNKEDGTDTEAAQGIGGILDKITDFITNPLKNIGSIFDSKSQNTSGADKMEPPETTGNFLTDLAAYLAYAAACNAQVLVDTAKEKIRIETKTIEKMKAENIRQNLLLIVDFNENRLKSINKVSEKIAGGEEDPEKREKELHERASKLKDIILKKSTSSLLLIAATSAADVIIIDGYQLTPIPGKTGINMFYSSDLNKDLDTKDRLEMQAEIQNHQLKTLVDSING